MKLIVICGEQFILVLSGLSIVKYCLVSIYRKLLIMKYFLSELNDFGKFVSSFIRVMKPTAGFDIGIPSYKLRSWTTFF